MPLNRIRKEDIDDIDFVDSYELLSDGYGLNSIYLYTTVVSTTSGTQTVVINLASDGQGIFDSIDHPAQSGDIVWLSGTSAGAGDGYFTIANVIDDVTFTINETFSSSTGGNIRFQYQSGASKIGYDNRGDCVITHDTVQEALKDIDTAICDTLTDITHPKLRQLIHLADGIGGPFEGFASGAYRETTYPIGLPFYDSQIWYNDITKTKKIVEKTIVRNAINMPVTITWKAYDVDGVTVLSVVTDSIVYVNNIFETNRTRTIT
jgi:hypothetical protein